MKSVSTPDVPHTKQRLLPAVSVLETVGEVVAALSGFPLPQGSNMTFTVTPNNTGPSRKLEREADKAKRSEVLL